MTKNQGKEDYYRFVNYIIKDNYPTVSFTTSTTNYFEVLVVDIQDYYLRDNFYNGYSFIYRYDEGYYEYNTFILYTNESMTFHVCHKTASKNISYYKNISVGEEIYSTLKNFRQGMTECFKIENAGEYEQYILNFITKTKNLLINMYKGTNFIKSETLGETTGNIFLEKGTDFFCFNQYETWYEQFNQDAFSAVHFQIIGVKNKIITQNLNMPLINGVPMLQNLEKGQILYYRLKKNFEGSNYIYMHFKRISGYVKIYRGFCYYLPECTFSEKNITNGDLQEINYVYDGNAYLKEDIKNTQDLDQRYNVTVYVVYCSDVFPGKTCNYSISLNNDGINIVLDEHKKFYSFIDLNATGQSISNKFVGFSNIVFYYPRNYPLFFEIHLITGKISDFYVNGKNKNFVEFGNKTYYYIENAKDPGFTPYVIDFQGKNKSFFYIQYFYVNNEDVYEKYPETPYIFSEREMHYNFMKKRYYYSFPDSANPENYIISLSGINSALRVYPFDERYIQLKIDEIKALRIYCTSEGYSDDKHACEFIASTAILNNNSINKNVDFDGFYQYYILNSDVKTINLYYYFTEEQITSKMILVNVHKNSLNTLKIEYGFNKTEELNTKLIYKYNEVFIIDISNIVLDKPCDLDNILNKTNYFFIRITKYNTNNDPLEFRIKTNIKNIPTYLGSDGIDFGYLKPNEYRLYHFDYKYNRLNSNIEEVYVYNKGNVKIKACTLKADTSNYFKSFDLNNIDCDRGDRWHYGDNHIAVHYNENNCGNGCKIIVKVYLEESDSDNNNNKNNLYYIYRNTQIIESSFTVDLNTNIFGTINENDGKEKYIFKTKVTPIKGKLVITLNCQLCQMCLLSNRIDTSSCHKILKSSSVLDISSIKILNIDYLYFAISGESGYYYLSISDSTYPKNIEQLESEPCYHHCKYIFPLHNFYNFSNALNDVDITKIIFFVPDYEKVNIYYDFSNMNELINGKENNNYNNKLAIDLNISEIMLQEKYLRIEVKSEQETYFNIIMNKFISSPNIDGIKYSKNIIFMSKNEKIKNDILSLDPNSLYKISLYLISGIGMISLDESGIYNYTLNYEHQPEISLFIKLPKFSISSFNYDTESNFTFFINATKIDEDEDMEQELLRQKNYKIKYFREEDRNIFPLNVAVDIENQKNKTLFVNYRFIELEKNETRGELYQTTDEGFIMNLTVNKNDNDNNITLIEGQYYPEFRRGYAFIDLPEDYDCQFVYLFIDKNYTNLFLYNKIFLEITPIFINKENQIDNDEEEEIYIPKNTYIQLDLNKSLNLIFTENDHDYNYISIDIGNTSVINITNKEEFDCSYKKGKYICSPLNIDRNKKEYIMKLQPNYGSILVRYTTRKSEYPYYQLTNNTLLINNSQTQNEGINSYELNFKSIDIMSDKFPRSDFKIIYFIRVYNFLDFFEDNEIDNIIIKNNAIKSFRKEMPSDTELKSELDIIKFDISFGDLEKKQFYINLIAACYYFDNVEYIAYHSNTIRLSQLNDTVFSEVWIAPLVIIILIFLASVSFIVITFMKKRKSKNKKVQDLLNDKDKE